MERSTFHAVVSMYIFPPIIPKDTKANKELTIFKVLSGVEIQTCYFKMHVFLRFIKKSSKLQTNTYDIILMDLHMPEMNGFEASEYIRKTMNSQIPIIALTADVTTADFTKCKDYGMDDYISKPIDENLLYSKIIELVKQRRTVHE